MKFGGNINVEKFKITLKINKQNIIKNEINCAHLMQLYIAMQANLLGRISIVVQLTWKRKVCRFSFVIL